MNYFELRDGELYCEEIPCRKIAEELGTPVYIYSRRTLERHYRAFDAAFDGIGHRICFSVKANSNLSILRLFAGMGSGFDVVSGGELFRAMRAGADPERIVYSGVGKTKEEIRAALKTGILMFGIESFQELDEINKQAGIMGIKAPIALRVNPDVDPGTHPYISTGMKKHKFGIDIAEAPEGYRRAASLNSVEIIGVTCHIGSQLTDISPFIDSFRRLRGLIAVLRKDGHLIKYVSLGGGLGITYKDEEPPHPSEYAAALMKEAEGLDATLVFEPGRVIVGNAGILLTRVLYIKDTAHKHFIIVDAGMNDLIRPSLYQAYHHILAVGPHGDSQRVADVVGPICESGDFFAKDRELPEFRPGDLLAVMSAGAYGFSMASNYNSRPRPPEVMINGDGYHIIRRRETYEDLVATEFPPEGA